MRKAFILLAAVPSLAHAAPVYLNCELPSGKDRAEFRLSIDEQRGDVTYELPVRSVVEKRRAIFTADKVSFVADEGRNGMYAISFTISRVDLTFTRTLTVTGQPPDDTVGKCEVVEAPKRAF